MGVALKPLWYHGPGAGFSAHVSVGGAGELAGGLTFGFTLAALPAQMKNMLPVDTSMPVKGMVNNEHQ